MQSIRPISWTVAAYVGVILAVLSDSAVGIANLPVTRPKADFYVATTGDDTNDGSAAAPFATLIRARDAIRKRIAAGLTRDVLVLICGGTYYQSETLAFGPGDSGTTAHSITYAAYPGEKVILSGGREITGWKKGADKVWTAQLPEVKAGKWYFRQIFVDGKRATRARTPNTDDKTPWWIIKGSTLNLDDVQDENQPFDVRLNNPIRSYENPGDVELICIYNNEGGRKRLQAVNQKHQSLTVAPPHRWNPKVFGNDWYLCAPTAGKSCYLENASEMLDQEGEWYLDRTTGILSYQPLPGENLTQIKVVAPVVQNTLLAVVGTRQQPVVNVHFRGVYVQHVDWPLPRWGYNGLFCCNVAVLGGDQPGHRFIEAAVEYEHARSCNFVDGGIAHVGGMGLCLRDGTAHNAVEGNHIHDLGGGGIGAGGCNVAGGHLYAAPPPHEGDYQGYRIANNYVHHCGLVYYGGSGICLYLSQDAVVAHNLVHDTAYFGICHAGSQDLKLRFTKNNTLEYNHIYNAMQVTVDGSAMYITFAHYDRGTVIRGNLIHDTRWNKFGRGEVPSGIRDTIPCHGLYLDGNNTGCSYQHNVVYANAGGPLLFNSHKSRNEWVDNLFQKEGSPPPEYIEALQACVGLEPAYRQTILKQKPTSGNFLPLLEASAQRAWSAYQLDLPDNGTGVVEIFRRTRTGQDGVVVRLCNLDAAATYEIKGYAGKLAPANKSFFEGTFFGNSDPSLFTKYMKALDDLPILTNVVPLNLDDIGLASVNGKTTLSGPALMDQGLTVKPGKAGVFWIVYQRAR